MKILLATPSIAHSAGGPAYSVPAIGRSLLESGMSVRLLAQHGTDGLDSSCAASLHDLRTSDVVHNFGAWTPFNHFVALSAGWLGRPLIVAPLGMLEPWALGQKSFKKWLGLHLYQRGDLERAAVLHATSQDEADNLRALAPKVPIAVIPHGVDLPNVQRTQPSADVRPRSALFMSRIHPKKGLLELARAWAQLRPDGWRVRVAGPDDNGHWCQVEDELHRLGIRHDFEFVGTAVGEQKRRLFAEAELFLLPTFSENFGLVVAEALAHGLPVITTRGAPWRELQETRSGWWIDTGVEPLRMALERALTLAPAELFEMGQRGRQLIAERYGWSSRGPRYRALYAWLQGGPQPDFVT